MQNAKTGRLQIVIAGDCGDILGRHEGVKNNDSAKRRSRILQKSTSQKRWKNYAHKIIKHGFVRPTFQRLATLPMSPWSIQMPARSKRSHYKGEGGHFEKRALGLETARPKTIIECE